MATVLPIPIVPSLYEKDAADISTSTSTTSTKFGSPAPGVHVVGSASSASSRLEELMMTQKELWRKVRELEERDAETPLPFFGTSPRDRTLQAATTKADAQERLELQQTVQKRKSPPSKTKAKYNVYATSPTLPSNEQFTTMIGEISKLPSARERRGQFFQVLQFPTEKRAAVEILGSRLWNTETRLLEMIRRYMVWETEEERAWILGPLVTGDRR
ncbi:hypothetical protein BC937DRAFT_92642 [Endogone sp. FLAS-F59071]|nr:hypothetical protein BC937DRAFT_92642 [Endogone sp. FLAS-F59071]|eukprot:RUS15294.1 hypothetical protein BC937DRAFT_92642 [Endogone sp. FLAS-F59071]